MKIILAKNAGFCFGVRRAVEKAIELGKTGDIYTLGDLIHNQKVVEYLKERGVTSVSSVEEVPRGGSVAIRAHGVPPEEYENIEKCGLKCYDLTCPVVSHIHEKVFEARDSYDVIIIVGDAAHPEVIGIRGWAGEKAIVLGMPEEAENIPEEAKTALVVAQTTICRELFEDVYEAVKEKVPAAEMLDTICDTTRKRQEEVRELARISDAVIVVGDPKSSNTGKLYEIAKKICKNTQFIHSCEQLILEKMEFYDIISVVAGASTPDWIIREVIELMSELENVQVNGEETAVEEAAVAEVKADEPVAPEAASEEAMESEADFGAQLEKYNVRIRRGQFVKGVVVQLSDDEVCVNIGYKSDGIIKREDFSLEPGQSLCDMFEIGDEIEAEVVTLNDGEGNVRLSRKKIEGQLKWQALVENLDMDKVYKTKVTRVIKGGVLSKFDGYEAFIPASQLSLKYIEDLGVFVGQELDVKIMDVDKRQKRFVLSHKAVLQEEAAKKEQELFASFEKGSVVKGVVKRITDFGAFVDVGGVDGLLHVTDMSWVRVKHPKDVLAEGQEIEVKILNVDPEKKKISLGYKQLQPRPWDLASEKYIVGDIVEGKVVRIAPFGAFVELEPSIDGLVHISQVANRHIEKVEDILQLGEIVTAKVLEVNPEKRRISLSIRALIQDANAEKEAEKEKAEKKEREDHFSYTIPPVEEATTSLADIFSQLNVEE